MDTISYSGILLANHHPLSHVLRITTPFSRCRSSVGSPPDRLPRPWMGDNSRARLLKNLKTSPGITRLLEIEFLGVFQFCQSACSSLSLRGVFQVKLRHRVQKRRFQRHRAASPWLIFDVPKTWLMQPHHACNDVSEVMQYTGI